MAGFNVIGKSLPRTDAVQQVTGRVLYGDDLERPGMLYAKAHYSRHPHARILKINTAEAEHMPGVKGIITHADVPTNKYGFAIYDQQVLPEDKVRYRGDCIAVAAAETETQAQAAADAIKVEYSPLKAYFDPLDAMKQNAEPLHGDLFDSNVPHHLKVRTGDVQEGFRKSDIILEKTYKTQKVEHAPIEPHVALAEVEPDGRLVITTSTSRVFHYIGVMTKIMKMPATMLRIRTEAVGGAFGGKNEVMLEPWVGLLAQKTGRPVKMTFTREEEFSTSTVRHAYSMNYRTGVSREGRLIASEVEIIADCGAYLGLGKSTLTKAVTLATGPYTVPNVKTDGYLVYTNTLVGSSMRGMGIPQVCFACESHIDALAERLGIEPVAFRRLNLFGETGKLPNGQVVNASPLRKTLDRALELFEASTEVEA